MIRRERRYGREARRNEEREKREDREREQREDREREKKERDKSELRRQFEEEATCLCLLFSFLKSLGIPPKT